MENSSGQNENPVKLVVKQYIIQTKSLFEIKNQNPDNLTGSTLTCFKIVKVCRAKFTFVFVENYHHFKKQLKGNK